MHDEQTNIRVKLKRDNLWLNKKNEKYMDKCADERTHKTQSVIISG